MADPRAPMFYHPLLALQTVCSRQITFMKSITGRSGPGLPGYRKRVLNEVAALPTYYLVLIYYLSW